MRTAEREGRERAAYELAAAYCGGNPANPSSLSPARTAVSRRAECGASQRPMSARSTTSRPMALGRGAIGRRATSARSRHGWAGEIDGKFGLGLDFRKRRDDTARRRRMMLTDRGRGRAVDTTGNATAVNDLEALRDENHQLKVALSRVIEENKRYRVNKTRLEGELLRADGKVEVLLAELEQAPGNRYSTEHLRTTWGVHVSACTSSRAWYCRRPFDVARLSATPTLQRESISSREKSDTSLPYFPDLP